MARKILPAHIKAAIVLRGLELSEMWRRVECASFSDFLSWRAAMFRKGQGKDNLHAQMTPNMYRRCMDAIESPRLPAPHREKIALSIASYREGCFAANLDLFRSRGPTALERVAKGLDIGDDDE
jgi:hypothetical protein